MGEDENPLFSALENTERNAITLKRLTAPVQLKLTDSAQFLHKGLIPGLTPYLTLSLPSLYFGTARCLLPFYVMSFWFTYGNYTDLINREIKTRADKNLPGSNPCGCSWRKRKTELLLIAFFFPHLALANSVADNLQPRGTSTWRRFNVSRHCSEHTRTGAI